LGEIDELRRIRIERGRSLNVAADLEREGPMKIKTCSAYLAALVFLKIVLSADAVAFDGSARRGVQKSFRN
jgi:hypothetical protein